MHFRVKVHQRKSKFMQNILRLKKLLVVLPFVFLLFPNINCLGQQNKATQARQETLDNITEISKHLGTLLSQQKRVIEISRDTNSIAKSMTDSFEQDLALEIVGKAEEVYGLLDTSYQVTYLYVLVAVDCQPNNISKAFVKQTLLKPQTRFEQILEYINKVSAKTKKPVIAIESDKLKTEIRTSKEILEKASHLFDE